MKHKRILGMVAALAGLTPAAYAQTTLTRDTGAPVGDNQNSQTVGEDGPVLLEDARLIEKLQRFDRERIPERVVHARGTGAQGVFVSDGNFSAYSENTVFSAAGKQTPVFVRFSTVMPYRGSPEAARDPRGFAVKFYSDQGNWDIVGINFPVFFIRDAIKFPDFVHANKPSPVTNIQDPNRAFDFFANVPESTHVLTWLYTDTFGMPINYRMMDGYGVHAFRLVNAQGKQVFAKFHWKSRQGLKGMTLEQTRAADADYATRDLYDQIRAGNFPSWDLYVQLMPAERVGQLTYDAFDDSKIWEDVPEVKLGTMTLNKVPDNYFEYSEESAFAPSNLIPGVEASPDRMLQGRLFAYADTQRYRLGVNFAQLPVNRPLAAVANNNQDGFMAASGRNDDINYEPSLTKPTPRADARYKAAEYPVGPTAQIRVISKLDNFRQAGALYRTLSAVEKEHLVKNLASDLGRVNSPEVRRLMVGHFYAADADYGTRLAKAVNVTVEDVRQTMAVHPEQFPNQQ
ncbi:catalase [Sphingomonas trueperi]|uniref:catalase n=1 Tax=Sphingomonas trueperi TaxID=53317 RepID=UPI00339480B7